MNTTYMYPENLKAKTDLWLWSLRDFAIIAVALLLSILALVELGLLFPAAFTLCFGFLTIRMGDLVAYVILSEHAHITLHTKTETEVSEDE